MRTPAPFISSAAETRPDEITALADILAGSPPARPVRVLLLSRTAGAWWANLAEALGPHLTSRISLEPLTGAGQGRRDAYAAAVTGLVGHLAALPHLLNEQLPERLWGELAGQLAADPPGLDDSRLGNALTLQTSRPTAP